MVHWRWSSVYQTGRHFQYFTALILDILDSLHSLVYIIDNIMADEDEVIRANNNNTDDEEVFVYMGGEASYDAVRARVHPSVTVIPAGLTEIGNNVSHDAFYGCHSLKHIHIPSTVKTIGNHAFCGAPLRALHLPDSIESIGDHAFCHGRFPKVRIPQLVTTFSDRVFYNCSSMFSAELPGTITQMGMEIFDNCRSLRNVAVPPQAVVVDVDTFKRCTQISYNYLIQTKI